jgi:hypothetical protein
VIKIPGFLSICILCELSVIKWLPSLWIKFVAFLGRCMVSGLRVIKESGFFLFFKEDAWFCELSVIKWHLGKRYSLWTKVSFLCGLVMHSSATLINSVK